MPRPFRPGALVGALLALASASHAQSLVDITYRKDTGGSGTIVTETFTGTACRVPVATDLVLIGTSDVLIVRPVLDPVLEFGSLNVRNATGLTLSELRFSVIALPVGDPFRPALGLIDDGNALGGPFTASYQNPIGPYNGDALFYTGQPLYDTLRFTGALLPQNGIVSLSFLAGFPPPVGSATYQLRIDAVAVPEPGAWTVLGLAGLTAAGLVLRRRGLPGANLY